jgi:hypothetical protein
LIPVPNGGSEYKLKEYKMNYHAKNSLCPFVKNPLPDCFCFNLTSRDINSAIYYCSEHFEKCEIFKKNCSNKKELHKEGKNSNKLVSSILSSF